jgi:hypothetical protein
MKELADHDIHLWLTGSQYLAIRHLAEADDRSVSAYIRRIVAEHLESVSERIARNDRDGQGRTREQAA